MGRIQISEFKPADGRGSVRSGQELEVALTVLATPLTEGATDEVELTSSVSGCTVTPARLSVAVEPLVDRVTRHFRVSLCCATPEEVTEITARTAGSGSAGSFVIRVVGDKP